MKKLFFILTFLDLRRPDIVRAEKNLCNLDFPEPEIEYYSSYGKLNYDFGKNQQQVTALAKKHNLLESGMFASGLAIADIQWEVSVNTRGALLSTKSACILPARIKLFIGYSNPVIYIANHLRKNTCVYDVVMRHEQTHQQINKTALEYFRPQFFAEIQKIAGRIKPRYVENLTQREVDAATQAMTQEYIDAITPMIELFKKELKIEHSKLDHPDNYRMEALLCK